MYIIGTGLAGGAYKIAKSLEYQSESSSDSSTIIGLVNVPTTWPDSASKPL
jgi:hypothetical protein